MRASHTLVFLVVGSAALAGCTDDRPAPSPGPMERTEPALFANGTWPSGASARDFIASYVMTHPYRVEGDGFDTAGTMAKARDDLAALLADVNLTVVRHSYAGGQNILGVKNGTQHPGQWVVLSAHYDSASAETVYGAWDDGAGVATLLELGRAFRDWEFPFTVVFAFFDGEEKGLVGSARFVDDHVGAPGIDVVANLNTDPPGLNWPCGDAAGPFPVKVIQEDGKAEDASLPRYGWLRQAVAAGLDGAKVPAEALDQTPGIPVATAAGVGLTGTSDHASFGKADVANAFLGGTPTTDAGAAAALTYPLHTPLDTLPAMEARCQSGSLAGGLQTIVDLFAHSLSWMALHPAPA